MGIIEPLIAYTRGHDRAYVCIYLYMCAYTRGQHARTLHINLYIYAHVCTYVQA
jgi:hypothetical protein